MSPLQTGTDEIRAVAEHGRICALSAQCARDLQGCAADYPGLFSGKPFDATLFTAVSMANAFGSPGDTRERLEVANRTSLWIFALDWLVDYVATSRADLDGALAGPLAIAEGRPPAGDAPLARFLAAIRDRVGSSPSFAAFGPVWRDELRRMLDAMTLEWEWKAALTAGTTAPPSFDAYLANADNFGSTFVNAGHWIFTSEPSALAHLDALLEVSRKVQQVLRLLNDLATYKRDVTWGDLNAMLLGVDADAVRERIAELVAQCRVLLEPLRDTCPREAVYLERQIGYSMGFYGAADYWGEL
ncbi:MULTISPECIES: terpene synthase family protein [Thermomonosporaceae]|uniref:terpene synthase family protein n=1 Tax=Thermomonosporaceae TaxID=2012 RepID=UPI00255B3550|nr:MULTISPECIES: terpene synthase family protein [Thermomonosporaceae]MDL4777641.1 terpene synthase family protein [Actinomadura xylanilytica]